MSVAAWLAAVVLVLTCSSGRAEDAAKQPAEKPANDKPLNVKSPYRHLAPGVMISVDPMQMLDEGGQPA